MKQSLFNKYLLIMSLMITFSFQGCYSNSYQDNNRIQSTPTGTKLPTKAIISTNTPLPTLTRNEIKADEIREFLEYWITDPRYDPNKDTLSIHLDNLEIDVKNFEVIYSLIADNLSPNEIFDIAMLLFLLTSFISDAGGENDWNLSQITVDWSGSDLKTNSIYLIGHPNFVSLAKGDLSGIENVEYRFFDEKPNLSTNQLFSTLIAPSSSKYNPTMVSTPPPPPPIQQPPCICSYNAYNCGDFPNWYAANQCYEYCYPISGDIHWLDDDKDGYPCEWLD